MALELRTEYPLDHKAATGAPVIAQESFGLHEVFSVRKKRSKVVTRQNARPFYTEGWVFLLAKSLTDGLVFTYYNENNKKERYLWLKKNFISPLPFTTPVISCTSVIPTAQ